MKYIKTQIVDQRGNIVAEGNVTDKGAYFGGKLDLANMPEETRKIFEEFEEIVSGQMLSFLDEIEDKIAGLSLKVILDPGQEIPVRDVQIFPSNGGFSFRLIESTVNGKRN
jgi:hypothetical protein